ncbi:MAG: molybdopterin-guanine dinucleotide biosynthesis protein B [Chloroflexi bacterium]|nr:molybdopterin-guanine dinucleotide biosynthesis protein B [Chloroflexota bacterium]
MVRAKGNTNVKKALPNSSGGYQSEDGKAETPMVCFVGVSGSGKTTLLEIVVKGLKSEGYRVATIKHCHDDFDIDRPGKDSWRLAQAGSDIIAVSSPHRVAVIEHVDAEPALSQFETLFRGKVDIILVEGNKNSRVPKIVVLNHQQTQEPLRYSGEILATITPSYSSSGVPQFDPDDIDCIMKLLIGRIPFKQVCSSVSA